MATRKFYVDIDVNQQQLKNLVLENLATAPTSPVPGQTYFDTVLSKQRVYDGSSWVNVGEITGAVIYKGTVAHDATAPVSPKTGDMYNFSSAGVATNFGGETVEVGDSLIYNGTSWDIYQRNLGEASEESAGYLEIATQFETDGGKDDIRAVTPLKLENYITNKGIAKKYSETIPTLTGGVAVTITHNFETTSVIVQTSVGDELIDLGISNITLSSVDVTSNSTLTDVLVTVIG